MIPINQKKPTICTKKNPKRIDATVFVWTKHTCTSDCIMQATQNCYCQHFHETAGYVSNMQTVLSTLPEFAAKP
jgi:hypothetical protein